MQILNLNPNKGDEQVRSRPILGVSPNLMNDKLNAVIVAPMTTRVHAGHGGKSGEQALDQLRTIDKSRLEGSMDNFKAAYHQVLSALAETFSE